MFNKLVILVLLFILFFFINNTLKTKNIENFINNIFFLNKEELYFFLEKNNDNYYETFSSTDLKVRNINNIDEYKILIKKSVDNFSESEKNKIISCIKKADIFFNKFNKSWFDGKKCNLIPWKIGCIKGKYYENGLPHTRSDVIILSKKNINDYSNRKLINTLIHEKVHVYQKIYTEDTNKFLILNNFKKIKKRGEYDNIRANPDLDNYIYSDDKNNIYKAIYNKNPKNVEDITYKPYHHQTYEHPFESMSIYIENKNDIF